MDLSVVVFIKLAASGDKLGLDGASAANTGRSTATPPPRSLWPAAVMTSSSRRACIGFVASVEAAEAGGDQTTPSWPPLTAAPVIGNSGAPLEHLASASVAACGL
jgi:hypothetical protein